MPLLGREVELSPPTIFQLEGAERPWWVAHTRSRQEKALARHLLPLSVPFYVPMHEKRLRGGDRDRSSYLPLFPGYVFFRGSVSERRSAVQSRLVVQVLEVDDQARLQRELFELHALQESGASLFPFEPLGPGDAVRIAEGPFEGYTGVILRGQARPRLLVSITMLCKTVAVEFDRDVLCAVPAARRPIGRTRTAVA
jgi:transcription antitermination factor NusG